MCERLPSGQKVLTDQAVNSGRFPVSSFTDAEGGDPGEVGEGRAVVLLRNGTTEPRTATVVLTGRERVVHHASLAPGEVGVVSAPTDGAVVAEIHADDASASMSFDPETAPVPPLFALREGRVLLSSE